MRQRLHGYLPILLIALMVQILAPIGATWTAVLAASDPLGLVEICHSDSTHSPSRNDPSGNHAHDACALCCATQAAASLDPPKPTMFAAPDVESREVVWHGGVLRLTTPRIGSNAKARAPPSAA
jgi:hypothetical protein